MNPLAVTVSTIGIKTSYEIIILAANLLKSTGKILIPKTKEHKYDFKTTMEKLDIIHKLNVIKDYLKYCNSDKLAIAVEGVNEIFTKIERLCNDIKIRIDSNKKVWFFLGKTYLDDLITELERLNDLLNNRFKLLLDIYPSSI